MSSPSSAAAQPPVDHQAALTGALAEVGGLSFFGYVEPVEPSPFPELAATESAWVSAAVPFRGRFDGEVHCAVPVELARELVSSFSGGDAAAEEGPRVEDLLGEFVNMVCGSWLSRACPHEVFSLGSPRVTWMPAGWAPGAVNGSTSVPAVFNDRPIALWMTASE